MTGGLPFQLDHKILLTDELSCHVCLFGTSLCIAL